MTKVKAYIRLLRPHHWVKNILCFAGVFFAEHFDLNSIYSAFVVVAFFALASSTVYIFNDIMDCENDRGHPVKKNRPIASGQVSIAGAWTVCIFLLLITLGGSYFFHKSVFICLVLYLLNNLLYSMWLKRLPLLDVMSISFGFMLRLFAGVYVLNESPTVWFSLCTFFLTLLFGFSKRRAELSALSGSENLQRASLDRYSLPYLDSLINSSSTMTIIAYGLFSTSHEKNPNVILTLPIVYYAIMHYKGKVLIQKPGIERFGEEPERQLFDATNVMILILWLVVYYVTSRGWISILI